MNQLLQNLLWLYTEGFAAMALYIIHLWVLDLKKYKENFAYSAQQKQQQQQPKGHRANK